MGEEMRNTRALTILLLLLVFSVGFVISGCEKSNDTVKYSYTRPNTKPDVEEQDDYFGIIVFNSGWIGVVDGLTQTVSTPLLEGELGSAGGGIFDVVITPDGQTAIVSNFGDGTVYFIDTSDPQNPYVLGSLFLEMYAEDIALTPDGTYAIVSDGGFTETLAVIDVESRTLVDMYDDDTTQHQAVAVTPDGQTVLTVNYFGGLVNVFTIDGDGELTFVESIDVTDGDTIRPVNIGISPDGETAIVAAVGDDEYMAFPVLRISGPGQVDLTDMVTPIEDISGSQSVAFSSDGSRAALHCVPADYEEDTPNLIVVLDITGPGEASDADQAVEVDFYGRSQLFGVDTMAADFEGGYLFVANTTTSDAMNHIQILDADSGDLVTTITFDPVTYDTGEGDEEFDAYPVGIAIWQP